MSPSFGNEWGADRVCDRRLCLCDGHTSGGAPRRMNMLVLLLE